MRRKAWTTWLIALLVSAAAPLRVAAQTSLDADSALPDPREMARVEASADRALVYLLKTQNPDGSWPSAQNYNGVNAMCLLAFLGRGHEPGRGPYKIVVDRAINFILTKQDKTGLYTGSMYDHALCTLAMIEAYGFIPKPEMRASVQRAVDLIVKAQAPVGGWRYTPAPTDADLSVTVMQVVALRAAQNARLDVPQKTIDQARAYVRSCAVAAGGFSYTPGGGASLAQCAAGSLSLQLLGGHEDPNDMLLVTKALDVLKAAPYNNAIPYQYYTTYYAMQSTFQVGGDYWANWHPRVRQWLLENQAEDGSYPAAQEQQFNGPAKCYSTALGAMVLEVYMHYLPAYQR